MSEIIYKKPVLSSIILNVITLTIMLVALTERAYWALLPSPFWGKAIRKIVDNGKNMDRQKERIITRCTLVSIIVFVVYALCFFTIEILGGLSKSVF